MISGELETNLFLLGIPAVIIGLGVAGGYVGHKYSPTYTGIGLGVAGGLAVPLGLGVLLLSQFRDN